MSVMDIIKQCIEEKKELRDKELNLRDVRKAIKNNKFRDLILNKIYPELRDILEDKENSYPTYYRIDAALASEYKLVPVHGVFVFLRPDIRTPEQFKSYFGYNSVDEFLEDVKEKRIIPMIGWIDKNEETYKPYTTVI